MLMKGCYLPRQLEVPEPKNHNLAPIFIIDGRTQAGPWAWMCPACHAAYGCGFGTGNGMLFQQVPYDDPDKLAKLVKMVVVPFSGVRFNSKHYQDCIYDVGQPA